MIHDNWSKSLINLGTGGTNTLEPEPEKTAEEKEIERLELKVITRWHSTKDLRRLEELKKGRKNEPIV